MPKQYASPPAMQIDTKKTYRAVMNTSKGAINIDLFADRAPYLREQLRLPRA